MKNQGYSIFKTAIFILLFQSSSFAAIDVEMILNNSGFVSFDHFKAELFLNNHEAELPEADIFGILEIEGIFYFWPDFGTDVNYRTVAIAEGETHLLLLEFDFPDIESYIPYGPIRFWGAWYVNADRFGYDMAVFWLDTEHKWTPTPGVTATPSPTPEITPTATPTSPSTFRYIPPGTFQMGAPPDEMCRDSFEGPQHTVTISHGFYMLSTEVTQQQWLDIFGRNPAYFPGMNRPVESVTWYDCCIYCNRLSQAKGLTPCYYSDAAYSTVFDGTPPVQEGQVYWKPDANGYRLPTEAEWEYACRAGTTTAYNSGVNNTDCDDDPNLNPLAWYISNSDLQTHPVGMKLANSFGLYDMHGNVWEWCWDWFDNYSSAPATDPTGPSSGSYRIGRGGHFGDYAETCRSANRGDGTPDLGARYLGFRLLRQTY